jgi:sugar/nucleoside kinase (ribokinase family)
MTLPALVIGLGEVLWDLLPSGKVLGGTPANFAYMAQVLGDRGIVASRVGRDELGGRRAESCSNSASARRMCSAMMNTRPYCLDNH